MDIRNLAHTDSLERLALTGEEFEGWLDTLEPTDEELEEMFCDMEQKTS